MKHAPMTIEIEIENGLVQLIGSNCKYWHGYGLPDYEGPIDGLPDKVIQTLLQLKVIKNTK